MRKTQLTIALALAGGLIYAQEADSIQVVQEVNFIEKLPVTQKKITKKQLQKTNLGQDLPVLLKNTPSLVTTSDAGAGVGYTGLRIRGVDQTRINVTLNGIPYNDSESQGVYWVNMPDVASSLKQVNIQRGVGSSSNGTASFGASVNLQTENSKDKAAVEIDNSYGSFNTHKHSIAMQTGKINDYFSFNGRVSFIKSDGFIDRASSDLFSYLGQANYKKNNTEINFLTFGGKERTYQAWNGITPEEFENNETFNSAGAIYGEDGIRSYYKDEVDNYKQNHYQVFLQEKNLGNWDLGLTLNYTYGRGYYEQYKQGRDLQDYGLATASIESDLVTRKWLKNDFLATAFKANYQYGDFKAELGANYGFYDGDHFGNVIWASNAQNTIAPNQEWYRGNGTKKDASSYVKGLYTLNDLDLFADVQLRHIDYKITGFDDDLNDLSGKVEDDFLFVNPKAGFTYRLDEKSQVYGTYGMSHREPSRADYLANEEKLTAEKLQDFELGYKLKNTKVNFSANAYYMMYDDQLVLEGINDVGSPIKRQNGKSVRAGLELDATVKVNSKINVFGNTTLSKNENKNWKETVNGDLIDFGTTKTTYSPEFIGNLGIEVNPIKNLSFALTSKHIGEQYMSNANYEESKLAAYNFMDFRLNYGIEKVLGTDRIEFNVLVNNVFNKKYANNGYYYNYYYQGLSHNPYYYASAGTNFLTSINVKF